MEEEVEEDDWEDLAVVEKEVLLCEEPPWLLDEETVVTLGMPV